MDTLVDVAVIAIGVAFALLSIAALALSWLVALLAGLCPEDPELLWI